MDHTDSYPVKLYIYDMSRGMARQLSPLMLGEFLTSYLFMKSVESALQAWGRSQETAGMFLGLSYNFTDLQIDMIHEYVWDSFCVHVFYILCS